MSHNAEILRLLDAKRKRKKWRMWGPYLSERSWGTVREDYSASEDPWTYFPHDHAARRAYRWGEDGLAGFSDDRQYLCFAFSFWNKKDPILKERLFGLSAWEGNHGEDVKELYFYLDGLPTHSYMRYLYKYPHQRFPYNELVDKNQRAGKAAPEYEIEDTGVFDDKNYFDIDIVYAKAAPDDIVIRYTISNRSSRAAEISVLPTLWFRNTWSWGYPKGPDGDVEKKPILRRDRHPKYGASLRAVHPAIGTYWLYQSVQAEALITDNETNLQYCFGTKNRRKYLKDGFHRFLVDGEDAAVSRSGGGTKGALLSSLELQPRSTQYGLLRMSAKRLGDPFADAEEVLAEREADAHAFYAEQTKTFTDEEALMYRQASAGMLWNKQFFYYDVGQWLKGDPSQPRTAPVARNQDWGHLRNADVISMPDKWEFPWYASWDLAFHCIALGSIDMDFAKKQLVLFTREWYMHPNGELPAYEWSLGDVNPPVHAWSALELYRRDYEKTGHPDLYFLETIFHKLLLNFTCWVNRRDAAGRNVFEGGFLGLDNIGVFDRSKPLPGGGSLLQADATSWMALYCLTMLETALELAKFRPSYQDLASKFLEHFFRVGRSMKGRSETEFSLWDEEDGFFYDMLLDPEGGPQPLKIRSLVGLMPLAAVSIISQSSFFNLPYFHRRFRWLLKNRPEMADSLAQLGLEESPGGAMISLLSGDQLRRVLHRMLDPEEFLSPFGIRSLSKYHDANPYSFVLSEEVLTVAYEAGESLTHMFGGNSNWRGPVWFPLNYLLIRAIDTYSEALGPEYTVEFPVGSGTFVPLSVVAKELRRRLLSLFKLDDTGVMPALSSSELHAKDPHFSGLYLFHEHFHGDTGRGLGASHQTGWTGLVMNILREYRAHEASSE